EKPRRQTAQGKNITEHGDVGRPSVINRKFAKRRLYDADRSRYVTLDDVARMVGEGARVRVLAAGSGADLTRQVLAQIFFEGESGDGLLDEVVLTRLIRLRDHPQRGVLSRHITQALESFPRPKTTGGEVLPFAGGSGPDPAHTRIDALQARLKRLIGEADRTRK
ncbi:MAG: polyhydroxyalkanoate synthesis regulator DNA-binding domain-containing protein, partial [Alphaproteobacteria bacterium]